MYGVSGYMASDFIDFVACIAGFDELRAGYVWFFR